MSAALLCEVCLYSKRVKTKVNVGKSTYANWEKVASVGYVASGLVQSEPRIKFICYNKYFVY